MLIVLSPAKSLNEKAINHTEFTIPEFLDKSVKLAAVLKKMDAYDLSKLMDISVKLAELNYHRFQNWHLPFAPENAKTALLTFDGDVYDGMDAKSFDSGEMALAQQNVLILSGFYGLLRPFDLIQPYRLEMGTKLKTSRHKDLYDFWGSLITKSINKQAKEAGKKTLINLASEEYFKAIKINELKIPIITPVFKQEEAGKYKFVSFYAKKARGLMTKFAIRHQISDPEDLKAFDYDGYHFNTNLSSENIWTFSR